MSEETEHKTVRELMTRVVISVRPSTPYKELVSILRANRIGAAPVVDASGQVVGVVSETDLLPKEEPPDALTHHVFESKTKRALRRKAAGLTAADLMTTPAITVSPETAVRDAVRELIDCGINQLPIVDSDGRLVGIVGRSDLLRLFTRDDASIQEEVRRKVSEFTRLLDAAKVDVTVQQGVVTLTGEIDRKSDDQHLVAMVHEVDGVVEVTDLLRVWWNDIGAGPIEQALLSQYQYEGSSIGLGW